MLYETHLDCDEILQRLAHLQPLNMQVPRMQEVVDPLPAVVISLSRASDQDASFSMAYELTSDCAISLS